MKRGWMRFWVSVSIFYLGHGVGAAPGDEAARVSQIYGKSDSQSPSTKGGQQLELLYYAFDWAGPDVPQVMECYARPKKMAGPDG